MDDLCHPEVSQIARHVLDTVGPCLTSALAPYRTIPDYDTLVLSVMSVLGQELLEQTLIKYRYIERHALLATIINQLIDAVDNLPAHAHDEETS